MRACAAGSLPGRANAHPAAIWVVVRLGQTNALSAAAVGAMWSALWLQTARGRSTTRPRALRPCPPSLPPSLWSREELMKQQHNFAAAVTQAWRQGAGCGCGCCGCGSAGFFCPAWRRRKDSVAALQSLYIAESWLCKLVVGVPSGSVRRERPAGGKRRRGREGGVAGEKRSELSLRWWCR